MLKHRTLMLTLLLSSMANTSLAENPFEGAELWGMSPEELGKIRLTSIATGTQTPIDKAAAVATVITKEDILAMGATDLDQVLETVPGLHVTRGEAGFFPKYIIRGITSTSNPQALVLINGNPITSLVYGNRGNAWGGMPVKNIERIDVIRGPGSALYGADAFSGVINITTKRGKDINGMLTGVRAGSFDTYGAWLEYGKETGIGDLGLVLEYQTTAGHKERVDRDIQSSLDDAFGTDASLAPGEMNNGLDSLEFWIALDNGNNSFNLGYQGRYNGETGPGIASALDPTGQYGSDRLNADWTHSRDDILDNLESSFSAAFYYLHQKVEEDFYLYPRGTNLFGNVFPDGVIGNPGYKERNMRTELINTYTGIDQHIFKFGIGLVWSDAYKITEEKNFNNDLSPKPSKETVDDIPSEVYLPEESRTSKFIYFQDEWQLKENWQLTSGIRYDHYSDFGGTWNPRLALIWATTANLTTKFLYGRAFRAPSLQEQHVKNNPILLGNEKLDPETIDTLELGVYHQPDSTWRFSANVFYYEIDDYIEFVQTSGGGVQTQAQNNGKRKGHGGELEINYTGELLNIIANFAHQSSEDELTGQPTGEAPNNQFYMRHEWTLPQAWQLDYQFNWVGKQKRVASDNREDTDDYSTIDLTLRKSEFLLSNLEISLSAKNLFNSDVREPAPYGTPFTAIPNDYPMAGRNFIFEVSSSF